MTGQWVARLAFPGLLVIGAGMVYAATVPKISPPKRTGKVKLVTHNITFARHEFVGVTAATLDTQAREGSKALQVKDSSTDVACPVKLQRSGDIAVFKDTDTFSFRIINTPDEFDALQSHVSQLVKVVDAIEVCDSTGTFAGCAVPGHIVMIATPTDPVTLVHEFGHHKGLDGDPDSKRIMFDENVSGKEVTAAQCDEYKK